MSRVVKVEVSSDAFNRQALSYPPFCVLCLKPSTKEGSEILGGHVPYCDSCHTKVKRLEHWKDSIFMISLIFFPVGAVLSLIGFIHGGEWWLKLFQPQNWIAAVTAGLLLMGIVYALAWLLLLPLRLILRSKLAGPGVKVLKSKKPGVAVLGFSNPEYAEKFRKANELR